MTCEACTAAAAGYSGLFDEFAMTIAFQPNAAATSGITTSDGAATFGCLACAEARVTPHWGAFYANCRGCCARSIARSPQFFEARSTGSQSRKYRALLEQVGGLVKPPVTHDEVRAAFELDAAHRKQDERDPTLEWA
jgi:hypothetical protein